MRLIFLDTGPLGLLSHPKAVPDALACRAWAADLWAGGSRLVVPGIADYEVRRELIRSGKAAGLRRLDIIRRGFDFDPVTQTVIDRAARIWADVRKAGLPTADDKALDGDAILAAQAQLAGETGAEVIVATKNVRHIGRFVDARRWETITA